MSFTTAVPSDFAQLDLAETSQQLSAFFDDPSRFPDAFALFRRLRELEPVHWSGHKSWVITGYPEGKEILFSAQIGRQASAEAQFGRLSDPAVDPPEAVHAVEILLASLINRDPPDHTRLRQLVSRTFSPRAVNAWQPRIDELVGGLVDQMAERDEFDFLHEVAYTLPETIICELLQVPIDVLRATASGIGASRIMVVRGDDDGEQPAAPADLRASTVRQLVEQVELFRGLIEERRRHPGDDLISALAAVEEDGERLTMDELIGTVIILIGAGHETTANLVTNGMLALIRHPDVYRRFRDDPDLLPQVLDEVLRYASPSPGQPRTALASIELGGKTISPGEQIFVILNAANRDPRVFADPERFDIERPNNRDAITFTAGIHHCLGAALARLEAGALFRAVAERLGPLTLGTDHLEWKPSYVRGLTALPVVQDRTSRHTASA